MLKDAVMKYAQLWQLGEDFSRWINEENVFASTLVDRIVTGYPTDEAEEIIKEIGYDDKLLDTAEPFHLWVIEGRFEDELPLEKAGINVIWTDDVSAYKKMKVRILNGAHTSLVFPSLLSNVPIVRESIEDELLGAFLNKCIFDCIIPTIGDTEENIAFANAVLERFANPYINHLWKSISLNSVSKFSVRVLPTIKEYYQKNGACPRSLVLALACLIKYYKTENPSDNESVIEKIRTLDLAGIISDSELFGEDISFLGDDLTLCTEKLYSDDIKEAVKWAMS
jgi:tagaturonate reductase